jgi:hypothetical protein
MLCASSHEKTDGIAALHSFHKKFYCIINVTAKKKGFDATNVEERTGNQINIIEKLSIQ